MSTLEERMTPRTGPAQPPPRRSRMRDVLHALSTVLIVSGVLLLADAGLTIVWQEPLSAVYNHFQQSKLSGQLDDDIEEKLAPTPLEQRALQTLPDARSRIAFAARALDRKIKTGQPIGRIHIKAIGVDKVLVEGTTTDVLPKGPGHYPSTPLPGAPGTVAFAGHRTTYGAPFRHVDSLEPGDKIELAMPYAKITYAVERLRIVKPTDTWVTERQSYNRLVLTACHPLYSAAQRIVVFARQVKAEPSKSLF
jgi:sortase A